MKINDWIPEDRPREKLINKGAELLTDTELLAIILRSGTQEYSVMELSAKILKEYSLNQLGKIAVKDLTSQFKGIGPTKAVTLMAAIELGRRRNMPETDKKENFLSSSEAYSYYKPLLSELPHEEIRVATLNGADNDIK